MKTIYELELKPENITADTLEIILATISCNLFVEIDNAPNEEVRAKLLECLNGAPDNVEGVRLLISSLKGNSFAIFKTKDGKISFEPEKADPKTVYAKLKKLISKIDNILENANIASV